MTIAYSGIKLFYPCRNTSDPHAQTTTHVKLYGFRLIFTPVPISQHCASDKSKHTVVKCRQKYSSFSGLA